MQQSGWQWELGIGIYWWKLIKGGGTNFKNVLVSVVVIKKAKLMVRMETKKELDKITSGAKMVKKDIERKEIEGVG